MRNSGNSFVDPGSIGFPPSAQRWTPCINIRPNGQLWSVWDVNILGIYLQPMPYGIPGKLVVAPCNRLMLRN